MILLLYGPNIYARDKKAHELINAAQKKYPNASFETLFGDDEGSIYVAHQFLLERGLFSGGKKILYVRHASVFSQAELWVHARTMATQDDTLCILSEDWHTRNHTKEEASLLDGIDHTAQYFAPYTSSQAASLICSSAKTNGVYIDSVTATYLYTHFRMNIYAVLEEVARLSLFSTSITSSLLRGLPEYAESVAVFDFAQAIVSSTTRAHRLTLWEHMIFQHVDMYMIFGYLAKMAKTQTLIKALARVDILVKSGRLEMDQALEELVIA
ncbi:MAG: hypothetical protein WC099_02170 [Candidatus Paceibacterota bacterium]